MMQYGFFTIFTRMFPSITFRFSMNLTRGSMYIFKGENSLMKIRNFYFKLTEGYRFYDSENFTIPFDIMDIDFYNDEVVAADEPYDQKYRNSCSRDSKVSAKLWYKVIIVYNSVLELLFGCFSLQRQQE